MNERPPPSARSRLEAPEPGPGSERTGREQRGPEGAGAPHQEEEGRAKPRTVHEGTGDLSENAVTLGAGDLLPRAPQTSDSEGITDQPRPPAY